MNYLMDSFDSVSVIILSYNQKFFLKRCIDSVINQEHKSSQIIVVDNASSDGTVDFLRDYNLNLEIIENEANLGFAKAMNKGIERAKGYYALFLAGDIILAQDCLMNFLRYIKSEDNIGLLTGHIYEHYNKKLIFSGKRVTLAWKFKQNELTLKNRMERTDLIPGCLLFSKTGLLRHSGGFDERYFFYFEDLDLSFRFKRAGFRNLVIPEAKAFHLEEGLGIGKYKTDKKIQFELEKNLLITYFNHAKLFWLILFFIRYMTFSFIKNIFDENRRNIILKTRYWVLCNLLDLIKIRFSQNYRFT